MITEPIYLHGVLQLVAAAGVAVEEAVLAQVVVDAAQALVPVGEPVIHSIWFIRDTVKILIFIWGLL